MSCSSSSVTHQLTVLPASSQYLFYIPSHLPLRASLIIPTKKMAPNYILFLKLFEKQLPWEPVIKCDNQTQHCNNVHFPLRSISLISNFKSLFKTSSKQVADERVSVWSSFSICPISLSVRWYNFSDFSYTYLECNS